jgi:hypothetical protein
MLESFDGDGGLFIVLLLSFLLGGFRFLLIVIGGFLPRFLVLPAALLFFGTGGNPIGFKCID